MSYVTWLHTVARMPHVAADAKGKAPVMGCSNGHVETIFTACLWARIRWLLTRKRFWGGFHLGVTTFDPVVLQALDASTPRVWVCIFWFWILVTSGDR